MCPIASLCLISFTATALFVTGLLLCKKAKAKRKSANSIEFGLSYRHLCLTLFCPLTTLFYALVLFVHYQATTLSFSHQQLHWNAAFTASKRPPPRQLLPYTPHKAKRLGLTAHQDIWHTSDISSCLPSRDKVRRNLQPPSLYLFQLTGDQQLRAPPVLHRV